jgi:transposase
MKDFLTKQQRNDLKIELRSERTRKYADRIRVILLLDKGKTYESISEYLFLDEGTIRNYLKRYKEGGIEKLIVDEHWGGQTKLNFTQENELSLHLENHTYTSTKEIVEFVMKTYKVKFSISGMRDLLHRLNFSYKKPILIPGKLNNLKQDEFIALYSKTKEALLEGESIYFVDAAHPQHNPNKSYGWIKKNTVKEIETNTGRARLNLNGALDIQNFNIVVRNEDTINSQSMVGLLEELRNQHPIEKTIYIILDNARYNRSYEVQFFAAHTNIVLMHLPPYSPNLNIIERLWKFFYKKVKNNKYYKTFKEFKNSCLDFFQNIERFKPELSTLLTDNFQRIGIQ